MNKLNLKNITENLLDTFIEAGKIAKEIGKKGPEITIKADKSPVTNGDIIVDKILREKIEALTPNIPIISEETVDLNVENRSKDFWLVDPIDGTRDYIKGKDEYTLNAALIIDFKPTIGIIFAPLKDRLFFSYGKKLAFEIKNNKKKLLTCETKSINKFIGLENSATTPKEVLDIYKKYKVTDTIKMSSSLKFCVLAAGEADIYAANARAYEWDIAAGHAILEHAGGSVTTHNEKPFLYGKKKFKNLPIIAKR
ncbi:3'(2'),5'-bisphosphate nucleotidase CysQ [bacterium]|nr:3'(2'),5'-bisphosphate nucleotidase CysQ [bacterium]